MFNVDNALNEIRPKLFKSLRSLPLDYQSGKPIMATILTHIDESEYFRNSKICEVIRNGNFIKKTYKLSHRLEPEDHDSYTYLIFNVDNGGIQFFFGGYESYDKLPSVYIDKRNAMGKSQTLEKVHEECFRQANKNNVSLSWSQDRKMFIAGVKTNAPGFNISFSSSMRLIQNMLI